MLHHGSGRRLVLLVDDDVSLHRELERAAREIGIDILHAMDGTTGTILAAECRPDLILLDVGPDTDGMRALACLKAAAETASIPVLIHSSDGGHDERIECFRLGADDYLEKPIEMEMLLRRVEHHFFKVSETMMKSGVAATGSVDPAKRAK